MSNASNRTIRIGERRERGSWVIAESLTCEASLLLFGRLSLVDRGCRKKSRGGMERGRWKEEVRKKVRRSGRRALFYLRHPTKEALFPARGVASTFYRSYRDQALSTTSNRTGGSPLQGRKKKGVRYCRLRSLHLLKVRSLQVLARLGKVKGQACLLPTLHFSPLSLVRSVYVLYIDHHGPRHIEDPSFSSLAAAPLSRGRR